MLRLSSPASAQDRQEHPPDAYLHLARLCVNESGWSSPADCAGIHRVLRSTRRGDETIVDTMRRHAPRVVGGLPARTDRERWVRALNAEATRPDHFPAELDWEDYRQRWVDVMEFAQRLLAGRTRDRCARSPITWGGPMDDWLALRRGLVRVECGNTRNRFWARPRPPN